MTWCHQENVCMRQKEKNVSQPRCPGPRIIKREGNNGMVRGFFKDSTKYRARTKTIQNEIPGKIYNFFK